MTGYVLDRRTYRAGDIDNISKTVLKSGYGYVPAQILVLIGLGTRAACISSVAINWQQQSTGRGYLLRQGLPPVDAATMLDLTCFQDMRQLCVVERNIMTVVHRLGDSLLQTTETETYKWPEYTNNTSRTPSR